VGAPGGESAPGEIRTPNLLIRSQMLYPLSYGRMRPGGSAAWSLAGAAFGCIPATFGVTLA
jgi:hypothetical protein